MAQLLKVSHNKHFYRIMDNNNNHFKNNENQPKMPRFNMNWFYGIAIIIALFLFYMGGADSLAGGGVARLLLIQNSNSM